MDIAGSTTPSGRCSTYNKETETEGATNASKEAGTASAIVAGKTVTVSDEGSQIYQKPDLLAEHSRPSKKSNRKAKKKDKAKASTSGQSRLMDIAIAEDKDKQAAIDRAIKLGREAESATSELAQFMKKKRNGDKRLIEFMHPQGEANKFAALVSECAKFYDQTFEGELISGTLASNVKLSEWGRSAYFKGKCQVLNFLGTYMGLIAESTCVGVLRVMPEAIQSGFSETSPRGQLLKREVLDEQVSFSLEKSLAAMKYHTDYLKILKDESRASPSELSSVEQKIQHRVDTCYRQVAALFVIACSEIEKLHKTNAKNSTLFSSDPVAGAFVLVNGFYRCFEKMKQNYDKDWLWADRSFKAPKLAELACKSLCCRLIAGVISQNFEMAQSSINQLSHLCQLPQRERLPACVDFTEADLLTDDYHMAACDLSLFMCQRMLMQGKGILEVQKSRQQVLNYLLEVKGWWSTLYPLGTGDKTDEKHQKLDQLCQTVKSKIDDTITNAEIALGVRSKLNTAESKKEKPISPADVIDKYMLSREEQPSEEVHSEPSGIVVAVARPEPKNPYEKTGQDLNKATMQLRDGNIRESLKLFLGITLSNSDNAKREHKFWANYGVIDVHFESAKQASKSCREAVTFLKGYEACLIQNRLPEHKDGTKFSEMVESFRENYGLLSERLSRMNYYMQIMIDSLLSDDSDFIGIEDIHCSLDMTRRDSRLFGREMNEFAPKLEGICQLRKAQLHQLSAKGGASQVPYDYEGCIQAISDKKGDMETLLKKLEGGLVDSCCEQLVSST